MKEIVQNLKQMGEKYSFMKKPICTLIIIHAVAISALIRANFNYIDDLGRVRYGYKGWESFSRYISNYFSIFIHADTYLTDISPLPQLLAIIMLSVAGSIAIFVLTEKQSFNIWNCIAIIPLGLSPYFLECLSYKYDSPYMALSVLSSIFPLLLYEYGILAYSAATITGIMVMCMTYQAASGIYPMLVILLCFNWWNKGKCSKEIIKFSAASFTGYISALLIYKIFIMKPIDDYASNSIVHDITQITRQFTRYFMYVYTDLKKWWLLLIGMTIIAYIYISVRDTSRKRLFAFSLSILTLLAVSALSFGMYPILERPIYMPRAMYGFGAFISLIGVSVMNAKKVYPAKLVYFYLCWSFLAFSFTYGNALHEQDRYTNFRINAVIEDMNDLEIFNSDIGKIVQLSGNIGQSPAIRSQKQNYQILNRLIPSTFGGDGWMWSEYYFYNYFSLKNVIQDSSIDLKTYDLPIINDTMYHTIKGRDSYILIELK